MPNYEFTCPKCESTLECWVPLEDYEEVKNGVQCPLCADGTVATKDASAPGFAIRGGTPRHFRRSH